MSDFLTDGQYTTVYNLLSFGLASMLFTSIFMILARDRVLPRYRLALITSTLVTGIAAYHYFRIINSFTEAFGEGGDPALYNVGYRYVDWLLTVPLLLVETVAVLALPAAARKGLLLKLVPASFLMIALGYPGDAQLDFVFPAPVWGALSTIPFLFILYVLFVELGRSLERQSPVVRKKVSNLRLLLIATWGVYPIAFLLNMNADVGTGACRHRGCRDPAPAEAGMWLHNAWMRMLVIVLGDQLDRRSAALDGFDPDQDAIWMAEVVEESTHVWSAKQRIAVFLAGMRHFRNDMRASGRTVLYRELEPAVPPAAGTSPAEPTSLAEALALDVAAHQPERLVVVEPGEHRVLVALQNTAEHLQIPLEVRTDRHHLCSIEEFTAFTEGRKQLRMEHFYRMMRRHHGVLMDGDQPAGGSWNYDSENRAAFTAAGPGMIPDPILFSPDELTAEVIDLVRTRFAGHPGSVEDFGWPVTPGQARAALADFIEYRLALFGRYQDAMWVGEPWLFHSRISVALNLKLLDPREVIEAAEAAWREGWAPLPAVEGFIRQVLGWREYVRGIYWTHMPEYVALNALGADRPLPTWYWTGDTPMACLHDALDQTLRLGYAHHIQRLMVTGLFAQLLSVDPRAVHEWYLAVYVDAVEWVELPNVLGMSQYADGGLIASKPYVATGKYIARMSNACRTCPFDPALRTGPTACPFTALYWDFLLHHDAQLAGNPRMALQVRNARALAPGEQVAIRARADEVRADLG